MIYKTSTTKPEESLELGERIGRALKGGEVIELVSDLGGGKTVLVKGMAKGLGYTGDVTSPTFTISRVYEVRPRLELHHFDFYRLGQGDIVAQELAEVIGDTEVITAIEWAENAGTGVLPDDRLRINLLRLSENEREIELEALGEKHEKIIEAIK